MTDHANEKIPSIKPKVQFTEIGFGKLTFILLNEQKSDLFRGETKEEVQEQILHFLGQQVLEVEKVCVLLPKAFESLTEK